MKACVLLACTTALVAATPSHNAWHQFQTQFGKQYGSSHEAAHRMSVFEQNQRFIDDHNHKFAAGLVTYTLKMNHFGDLTTDEINEVMNGYHGSQRRHPALLHQTKEEKLPAAVDWRSKGAVTPVKNQKHCGACWAFSATGSLEGQHFLSTKEQVSLSEQNLIDCSGKYGNHGCQGGLMDSAFNYIKDNGGLDTEESYPYEAKNGSCRFNKDDVGATLTGYVDVQRNSEEDLKHAVATVGPVSVGIDASQNTFHFYSSGVYYDPHCSSTSLNHGVLAVGYGSDPDDYWLVKNSWGESWGDKGYIKMARNRQNSCGIAAQASYPTV